MNIKERGTYLSFSILWWLCARLPEFIVKTIFVAIADAVTRRQGVGVKRLQFNLARVKNLATDSPEIQELSRQAMRSYLRYWADFFRISHISREEILKRGRIQGQQNIEIPQSNNRGVILAITHSGNWDWAGAWFAMTYGKVTTVAERLRPDELFQRFVDVRTEYGLEVLPHRGHPISPMDVLTERLNEHGIVALAADRDFTRRGITAQFFGHSAAFPAGPVKLAQATGAALVPATIWADGKTVVMDVQAEIEVAHRCDEDICQDLVAAFERGISAHPENWHMLQQIWPDHPVEWGGKPR